MSKQKAETESKQGRPASEAPDDVRNSQAEGQPEPVPAETSCQPEAASGPAETGQSGQSEETDGKLGPLQEELEEMRDKYLRLTAEFDNFRRRTAKEKLDLVNSAGEQVIKGFLPILDDCERALEVLAKSSDSEAAKEGTELIYSKLKSYLQSKGLAVMDVIGKEFDTDFHEAVAQIPAPAPEGKNRVVDVVQHGYTLNGKVIRYAKVVLGV